MREQEMRLRVFGFLKARMRNMIMPATIGIGLAVGGCSDSNDGTVVRYAAPVMPDASPDLNPDVAGSWVLNLDVGADDGASARDLPADARDELTPDLPTAEDASSSDVVAAEAALDAGSLDGKDDLGGVEHGSPVDAGGLDSQSDVGQAVGKYIAQMPDAAVDKPGLVPPYMVVTPTCPPSFHRGNRYLRGKAPRNTPPTTGS